MNNFIFFFFVIAVLAIVVYIIYSNKSARVRRKLKQAEFKPIKNFKNFDEAKIVGRIELVDEPLLAPFSLRPCACYHAVLEEETRSGRSTYYATVRDETVSKRFVIRDGEHIAYINDLNVQSHIVQDREFTADSSSHPPTYIIEYLNNIDFKMDGFFRRSRNLRFLEGILEANEQVAVFGQGIWKSAAELGLPAELGDVLEIKSTSADSVFLSDDPATTLKLVKAAVVKSKKTKTRSTTSKPEPFKEPQTKEKKPSKDRYSRSDDNRNYKR